MQSREIGRQKRENSILSDGSINHLAHGQGDHGGLPGTGLSLGDDVTAIDNGNHSSLLDGGGLLEAIGIDTTEKVIADAHLVEAGDGLDPRAGLEDQVLVV